MSPNSKSDYGFSGSSNSGSEGNFSGKWFWLISAVVAALVLSWIMTSQQDHTQSGSVALLPEFGNAAAAERQTEYTRAEPPDYSRYADFIIPPLSPEQALGKFQLEEGFRIEIVAHEPDVIDPVAMDIDYDGRLWVVEMISYMPVHDLDDQETSVRERVPQGRIVVLEDTDSDGRMDSSRVFMDELVLPRAIKVLDDGVLLAEPPNVWFISDTTGNGIGNTKELVYDSYGEPASGNVEHMPNGLMWGMDNWIHSSDRGAESIRRIHGQWVTRPFEQLAQWGITQDDWGRLYSSNNTRTLTSHLIPYSYSHRHPDFDLNEGIYENIAESEEMWPAHPTGVNRGYREGVLREDETLRQSTATGGPVIYRGDRFGDEYKGNAFVTEPAGNLIKRLIDLDSDPAGIGVTARFAYEGQEFLTSVDERFRPVNLYNSPDGSIYVVDMYRGIFQHARFLTDYLRDYAVENDLHRPSGPGKFGRIYRIVRNDREMEYDTPELSGKEGLELVEFLQHENGLLRDQAQQLLVQRSPAEAVDPLERFIQDHTLQFYSRLQSLWTLEGYDQNHYARNRLMDIAQAALEDPHPRVRAAAVRILESFLNTHADEVLRLFTELTEMESAPYVKLQLLASLGESGEADALHLMARILDEHSTDPYFQEMALSGSYQREGELQSILHRDFQWNEGDAERKDYVLTRLAEIAGDSGEQKVSTSSGQNENHLYRSGENIYQTCMACHGVRGEGIEGVATPLDGSPWVNSDPAILVRIILQGFANEETETNHEVMPAHRFLQDEEIAAVLTYIRQSWSNYSPAVTVEEVSGIREETRERRLEWTPGELRDLQDGNGQ